MNALSLRPRPLPLFAIAVVVLLAHALLLAWLVFTPTTPPNRPEQRLEWVTLQAAPPKPPAPTPHPAPPTPPRPILAKPTLPKPAPRPHHVPPRRAAQRVQQGQPITKPQAPAEAAPASPSPPAVAPHLPAIATSAPAAPTPPVPPVETAASYKAQYLDNPPPPYPRLSRQLGEEGTALLKVQVGPNGRALQITLMSSTGYQRLDEAAEATVAQWRFVAATRNGQAITSWVLVPIKFRIVN